LSWDEAFWRGTERRSYVRSHQLGIVCNSSTGFWMKRGNFRSPDVSFITKERLQGLKRPSQKFFQGSPDLAIEILSPSDTVEGIHERIVEYFENDTRLVWVVNLEEETVLVYRSPKPDQLLRAGNSLDGEAVVPGFLWPLAEIFAELEF
jgi:Uma2 family endonuclease